MSEGVERSRAPFAESDLDLPVRGRGRSRALPLSHGHFFLLEVEPIVGRSPEVARPAARARSFGLFVAPTDPLSRLFWRVTSVASIVVAGLVIAAASEAAGRAERDAGGNGGARVGQLVVEGARREAERKTPYIMEYRPIAYPGGDVPEGSGVCTDLVVRAFRNATVDLQKLLHVDRVAHPEAYPTQSWAYKRPDANIDHRRCPNLAVWFRRHAQSLTTETDAAHASEWKPGDVVFYVREGASAPWHVAVVSDRKDRDGLPMIVDSYPPATSESHRLDTWKPIHSHYRYTGAEAARPPPSSPSRSDASQRAAPEGSRLPREQ